MCLTCTNISLSLVLDRATWHTSAVEKMSVVVSVIKSLRKVDQPVAIFTQYVHQSISAPNPTLIPDRESWKYHPNFGGIAGCFGRSYIPG